MLNVKQSDLCSSSFLEIQNMRYHFLTLNCKTSTCFLSCVVEMKSVLILTLAFLACFFLEPVSNSCVFKQTRVALYNLTVKFTLTTDHAFNTQERAKILSCGLIYRIIFAPPTIFLFIFHHDNPFRFLF